MRVKFLRDHASRACTACASPGELPSTTIVFSIFALVTTPVSSWRWSRAGLPQFHLPSVFLNSRSRSKVLTRARSFRATRSLVTASACPVGQLKTQAKHLFGKFARMRGEFRCALIAQLLDSARH